jgi:hypothetical protein|nr:MAG TPA: hypothetical protein [Caudoviricetes sp.]
MIKLNIGETTVFDSATSRFKTLPGGTFRFENSLSAIARWESKWLIRFLPNIKKLTAEQLIDYCYCMCLDDNFDYAYLSPDVVTILMKYINTRHSAITFHSQKNTSSKGRLPYSSEVIYAQMTIANIPFECDKWNIERLLNLIRSVDEITKPKKRKSEAKAADEAIKLNREILAKNNTKG